MRLCVKTISASLLTVFSLSCEVSAACLGDQNATSVYVVAIVPQLPTAVTYANWSPLLERVGLNSKQCFDLVVPETIPLFEQLPPPISCVPRRPKREPLCTPLAIPKN